MGARLGRGGRRGGRGRGDRCDQLHRARSALSDLGPTVGFLAALLLLADGCRRAGLFEALGASMAAGSRRRPRRLLAMVFVVAGVTTAVLSLDATIVLLTPIVFATAARLRDSPRPHVYACSHLANSASLLLPVSNLTNLLAFHRSGLSFARFGGLMALPWLLALAVEWLVLSRSFAGDLQRPPTEAAATSRGRCPHSRCGWWRRRWPASCSSSAIGIAPVWVAAAGALVLELRYRPAPRELVLAAEPTLLVFVLGLGIVVAAAGDHGLSSAVRSVLPGGSGLPALLAVAAISAVAANLVNNLPATLIILPVVAASGPGAVLAMLVGVNVGPNLTYVGSLATLLWRRIVHAHEQETDIAEFTRLGVKTVPAVAAGFDGRLMVGSAGPVMRAVIWISRTPGRRASTTLASWSPPTLRSRCCTWRRATSRSSPRAAPRGCWAGGRRRLRGRRCVRSLPRRPRRCSRPRASASAGPPASTHGAGTWSARCSPPAPTPICWCWRATARRASGRTASGPARASSSTTRRVRCWSCRR